MIIIIHNAHFLFQPTHFLNSRLSFGINLTFFLTKNMIQLSPFYFGIEIVTNQPFTLEDATTGHISYKICGMFCSHRIDHRKQQGFFSHSQKHPCWSKSFLPFNIIYSNEFKLLVNKAFLFLS